MAIEPLQPAELPKMVDGLRRDGEGRSLWVTTAVCIIVYCFFLRIPYSLNWSWLVE